MLAELIESLPPSATRAQARQLLVKIIDDIPETIEQLASALDDAAADLAQQASVLNLLSRQRTWAGDFDRAIADAQAAADIAETVGATAERRRPAREAQARAFAGEPIAQELLGRAIALEQQLGDAIPVETAPRGSAECALWGDDLETALACTETVVAGGKPVGELAGDRAHHARRNRAAPWRYRAGARTRPGRGNRRILGVNHAEAAVLAATALVKAVAGRVDEARAAAGGPRADAPRRLRRHRPFGGASAQFLELSLGGAAAARGARTAHHAIGNRPPLRGRRAPDDIEALVDLGKVARRKLCSPGSRRTSAGLVTRARRLRCAGARRSSPRYEEARRRRGVRAGGDRDIWRAA